VQGAATEGEGEADTRGESKKPAGHAAQPAGRCNSAMGCKTIFLHAALPYMENP
jgi:hypothetical protein